MRQDGLAIRYGFIMLLGVIAAALLLTLSQSAVWAADRELTEVRVGFALPLSGPYAWYGEQARNAAELVLDDFASTESGFKVTPVFTDTMCDPAEASSAARRLTQRDRVDIVLGEFCTGATLAIGNVSQQVGIPLIVWGATGTQITEGGNPYLFRTVPHNQMLVEALADFMVQEGKWETIVVQYELTDFGIDARDRFIESVEEQGLTVVDSFGVAPGEVEMYSMVSGAKRLDPDAVVALSNLNHGVSLARTLKELSVDTQLLSIQVLPYPAFDELAGDASDGIIRQFFYISTTTNPEGAEFAQKYREKYGTLPEHYAAEMYDALSVTIDALGRSGVGEHGYDRDRFLSALESTDDYPGVMGPVKFGPDGQSLLNGRIIFVQNEGSELVVVGGLSE